MNHGIILMLTVVLDVGLGVLGCLHTGHELLYRNSHPEGFMTIIKPLLFAF